MPLDQKRVVKEKVKGAIVTLLSSNASNSAITAPFRKKSLGYVFVV